MKFTINWLKEHLDTKYNEEKIIDKLTNVGLEVESFKSQSSEQDEFVVAKILNAEQHPNADRLRVCNVDIGREEIIQSVIDETDKGIAKKISEFGLEAIRQIEKQVLLQIQIDVSNWLEKRSTHLERLNRTYGLSKSLPIEWD